MALAFWMLCISLNAILIAGQSDVGEFGDGSIVGGGVAEGGENGGNGQDGETGTDTQIGGGNEIVNGGGVGDGQASENGENGETGQVGGGIENGQGGEETGNGQAGEGVENGQAGEVGGGIVNEEGTPESATESFIPEGIVVPSPGDVAQDSCECVATWRCKTNGTNEAVIDIRGGMGDRCGNYLEVCCALDDIDRSVDQGGNNGVTPSSPYKAQCGHRNQDGVGIRITGVADEAQFGEFPWMVAVLKEEPCNCSTTSTLNVYQCGGSLITPRVVLTAAHCVVDKAVEELKIRAGEWDTQTKNERWAHQDRGVEEIIVRKDYFGKKLYHDVALLILKEPLEFQENINVACLPQQGEVIDESECFATGWGKDQFGKEGKYQVILKRIGLPIVPVETCQDSLRKTRLGPRYELHESFICAGGVKDKDTCKGDGGSPLVCPIRTKPGYYVQVGIVAWGIGCGMDGVPGVYVNVAKYRGWIDEELKSRKIDTSSYAEGGGLDWANAIDRRIGA